jgi:hypothetical protein
MAEKTLTPPEDVIEKNIALTGRITQYLLDHPDVLASLPDEFELVILPEDDPEIRLYNLELLDRYSDENKPIVIARTRTHAKRGRAAVRPVLFVPVAPAIL